MSASPEREESFLAHLAELRTRLLRAVLAVVLVFVALLPFAQQLYAQFARPLLEKLPSGGQLIAIDVASPFFIPVKLAFVLALMLAMPVVLYQLWAFVAPGLYQHERRLAVPLLVSATALFYTGCAFAWYLVLPLVFAFLTAMAPEGVQTATDIARYFDFVLVVLLAFGFSFELPVAVVILAALGWVDIAQLRAARAYVIVGVFLLAAFITPPDIVSQVMLAVPMVLLYELGTLAAQVVVRRAAARDGAA
jgi:sec-independent protein translocase protein TatC